MDPFFESCPAKMSDGRLFNDFKTATRRNEEIKYINDIRRDDKYRIMLQQNGATFMKRTEDYNKEKKSCIPTTCVHTYPTRVSTASFAEEIRRYNRRSMLNNQKNCNLQDLACPKFDNYKMTDY